LKVINNNILIDRELWSESAESPKPRAVC